MQSVYSAVLADGATGHSLGGALSLCGDAVGVFCSPSWRGYRTLVGRSLIPLQRCSRCILQSQLTEPQDTLWEEPYPFVEMQSVYSAVAADGATGHSLGGALSLCRDAVGVFCNPSWRGHRTLVGRNLIALQRCSRCILQSQLTRLQDTRWEEPFCFAEMQSVYSAVAADGTTGHSLGGSISLCRDAVGVFCSRSWRGHRTLFGRSLIPLQRHSRCILHPQFSHRWF